MLYNKEIHAAAFCLQSDGLVVEDKNGSSRFGRLQSTHTTHWHLFNHEQNADFDIVIKDLSYFEDPIESELLIQGMEFQPIEVATVTMANTTTSDPEKAIVAATSNLKGGAAQQRIMHAAQYSAA
ncbi:hypothetical protein Tco_0318250 [Tanacetum coccineum]